MTALTPSETEHFDLDYEIEDDIPPELKRDSEFIFSRAKQLITEEATPGRPGRVLDVGCAFGDQLSLLRDRRWEAWGLDASFDLVHYCRERFGVALPAPVLCAAAEALPFRSQSLDSIVCQGSLDHFVHPDAFLREAARVLKPEGRAVIAISNFDSLSCRLGRALFRLRSIMRRPVLPGRPFWQIPRNHTFRGTMPALRRFAEPGLELVECRGVSMLWLLPRWTQLVEALPRAAAWRLMGALDRVAYRVPSLADMLVTVWRPRRHG